MLSVAADLKEGLQRVEDLARNVNATLPEVCMKRTRNEADQVVQYQEIREELPGDCVVGSGGGPSSTG
jgi:hypothetical protein